MIVAVHLGKEHFRNSEEYLQGFWEIEKNTKDAICWLVFK